MPVNSHSPLAQRLLFALNFFRHPFMLGSIWPSSRYLVNEVLRPVDWERASVIVEYGQGVGTITAGDPATDASGRTPGRHRNQRSLRQVPQELLR